MSRRPSGPRLRTRREAGYPEPVYTIFWTENGTTHKKSTGETDPQRAQIAFEEWCAERRRAAKPRTGDPAEVKVAIVLVPGITND